MWLYKKHPVVTIFLWFVGINITELEEHYSKHQIMNDVLLQHKNRNKRFTLTEKYQYQRM